VSVAVLIVNYRTYDSLERCLTSLRPFVADDDEVIVVDWVSDDVARGALAAQHPFVRWLPSLDNYGFSAGINRAAASSTAPVLVWLNPDTVVEGPILRDLERWLQAHPQVGVVGPLVLNGDGSVQPSARRFPGFSTAFGGRSTWLTRHFPNNWFSRRNLLTQRGGGNRGGTSTATRVDWVAGSCCATPRSVFERLSGLDEGFFMYWEDADYCRRAAALGLECHYLPGSGVRHIGGVSSAHNVVPSIRAFHRSAYRLFWKHAGASRLMAPLVWTALWLRAEIKVRLI